MFATTPQFRDASVQPLDDPGHPHWRAIGLTWRRARVSLWRPGTTQQEPQTRLIDWRIPSTSYAEPSRAASHHFVGCDPRDGSGRISSPIESFDAARRRGVTRSGRVYELLGESLPASEARYVWDRHCEINGMGEWTDTTLQTSILLPSRPLP